MHESLDLIFSLGSSFSSPTSSTLPPIQSLDAVFKMKIPWPSSNSMKIKTHLQSPIFPNLWPIIRVLLKAKSKFKDLLKYNRSSYRKKMMMKKYTIYDSIRLHYNWCSSHVLPEPTGDGSDAGHMYYDPSWNSVLPSEEGGGDEVGPQLSGYLRWLEEKHADNSKEEEDGVEEIDRLADLFIANLHEKFRLEKQESYRRYQEMLARSL